MSARLACGLAAALVAASALAQPIPTGRGDVLLRRDCRSSIAREELTLFGNGTVRLRSGPRGEERMVLGEVPPGEVEALVAFLRAEPLAGAGAGAAGPEGDWVEQCLIELPVLAIGPPGDGGVAGPREVVSSEPEIVEPVTAEGSGTTGAPDAGQPVEPEVAPSPSVEDAVGAGTAEPPATGGFEPVADPPLGPGVPGGDAATTRFRYGHLDSLALPLARVVARIDELAARVLEGAAAGRLPADYRPENGDVLRRADGVLFRVVRATAALEGLPPGWELQGVVQPLAIYVQQADLPRVFVELVSRDRDDAP